MTVTLAGMGGGTAATMTEELRRAVERAQLIVGAQRLLDALPQGLAAATAAAVAPGKILRLLKASDCEEALVLYSGDSGFYSGARGLLALLQEEHIPARVLPGLSSVQLLAARLGRPWQDWTLCSAHGVDCDPVAEVCAAGGPVCFLTGGVGNNAADLCRRLTEAGLGELPVTVGENLSYPEERLTTGTAAQLAEETFPSLALLLTEAVTRPRRTPGIPDGEFIRGKTPMTKQEVRCAVLSKLALRPGDTCWDVGAGTGSVSVEMALFAKKVYAVERDADACRLIEQNRAAFGAWNLTLVPGSAPEALNGLPAPDAVFVGGSGGELGAILKAAVAANPKVRLCVSAIALETLDAARRAFEELGIDWEVTQISVARSKAAGKLHLMMAQNPVFLISGGGA